MTCKPSTRPPASHHFSSGRQKYENAVYDELFKHKEPPRLRSKKTQDIGRSLFGSVPGLNLAVSCRQIHHEATPFLFAQNRFLVVADDFSWSFGSWLRRIGPNRKHISVIHIDIDSLRSDIDIDSLRSNIDIDSLRSARGVLKRRMYDWIGDFLPLIWSFKELNLKVEFVDLARRLTRPGALKRYNTMVTTLDSEVLAPALMPLMRSPRSVRRVKFTSENPRFAGMLEVELSTLPGSECKHTPRVYYGVEKSGRIWPCHVKRGPPNLKYVLDHSDALQKILQCLVQDITKENSAHYLNLDVAFQPIHSLLLTSKWLNRDLESILHFGAFPVHFITTKCKSTFDRFEALRLWSNYMTFHRWHKFKPTSITLQFQTAEFKRLEELRFEATGFLWATNTLPGKMQIYVIRSVGGIKYIAPNTRITTLRDLRKALYYTIKPFVETNRSHFDTPCPRFWDDGHLRVREADAQLVDGTIEVISNGSYRTSSAYTWSNENMERQARNDSKKWCAYWGTGTETVLHFAGKCRSPYGVRGLRD